MMESEDNLHFSEKPEITSKLGEERIIFSDTIKKKTVELFSKTQERNILITNLALYNLKNTEIQRRIKIEDLKGITISNTSNQIILHCKGKEYDYLYLCDYRQKLAKILQNLYEVIKSKDLLFCRKDDKDLSKFVVGKKERNKNKDLSKINESEYSSIKDYINSDEIKPEPPPEPKPKIEKVSKASNSPVKVISKPAKGVPPPPPPPPPPPKVATTQKSSAPSKPVDLAAELEAKKNNLAHVEVKDYVSPALQNPEEAPQTTNSMMAAIMAKRNQMKKVGGGGGGGPKPNTGARPSAQFTKPLMPGNPPVPKNAPRPSAQLTKPPIIGNSTVPMNAPKPNAQLTKPPITSNVPKNVPGQTIQKPMGGAKPTAPKPSGAKPPMKIGGGGGGAFAAKMAALQARMAGPSGGGSSSSSTTPASSGPSKPIVELCEGNTKRMDINKVIGNLEKEKKKQASSSSKPVQVKVVSGKGKGIPPPPPPPPPPPVIK